MSQHLVVLLEQRGVKIDDIADIVFALQKPYNDRLSKDLCTESVLAVLQKREVQYTFLYRDRAGRIGGTEAAAGTSAVDHGSR